MSSTWGYFAACIRLRPLGAWGLQSFSRIERSCRAPLTTEQVKAKTYLSNHAECESESTNKRKNWHFQLFQAFWQASSQT